MEADTSPWRLRFIAGTLTLAAIAVTVRLVELQVVRHAEFAARAADIQSWEEVVPARPGDILDRHGRVLATTTTAPSLYVDPHLVDDPRALTQRLATALEIDRDSLARRIEASRDKRFLWVKRRLTEHEADAVRALELPRGAIGFRQEFRRHYPQGALAAHALGLRDIDNAGRGGIEEGWTAELCGQAGRRMLRRDARGYVVDVLEEMTTPPVHGRDVLTTLDVSIQLEAERRLDDLMAEWKPHSAAVIVMDPQSVEVLAMASRPAFDPNHPEAAPADGWKNQALASMFEPGSTFKPFIAAWAVEQGAVGREESIHCEFGAWRMGRRVLHDHHGYGDLSVTDVLVKSSNIGMAKIGERLGNAGLHAACAAFGFGRPTGLGVPGELGGMLRPLEQWDGYSTGSIPMGHEIAVTPLQLITAHAALSRGGEWRAPRLVRETRSHDGVETDQSQVDVVRPVVSQAIADWMVQFPMRETVDRGTGRNARIDGVTVYGKTGTAQMMDPATGGYSHDRHVCSFVCGAPAERPRALVLVMVEAPQGEGARYGGTVAAPTARDILAATLRRLQRSESSLAERAASTPSARR